MFVFFAIFFPCATVWARRKADVTYGILVGAFDLESLPAGTEELLMCTSSDFVGLSSRPATLGPMVQRYVMHRDRRSVVPNQELSSPCKLTFFFFFPLSLHRKGLIAIEYRGMDNPNWEQNVCLCNDMTRLRRRQVSYATNRKHGRGSLGAVEVLRSKLGPTRGRAGTTRGRIGVEARS